MRAICLFTIFLVLSLAGNSQLQLGGSYMIAAICKDGVVIGADTRACIYNGSDTLAYYDTIPKIFISKNFAFGFTKSGVIGNKTVQFYMNKFNEYTFENKTMISPITNFFSFIETNYPNVYDKFLNQNITSIGYMNGKPFLCGYVPTNKEIICGDSGIIGSKYISQMKKIDTKKYSCKQVGAFITKEINRYAKESHSENSIGGPIMLLMITNDNKLKWLNNPKKNRNEESFSEIMESYKNGRLNIHFTSPQTKKRFEAIEDIN